MASAFVLAKHALVSATLLAHPRSSASLSLAVDASSTHVGSVLQQLYKGLWEPLSFFSKKLSAAEMKYSTFDRELLAAYLSIRHFRFLLEGRSFQLWSDHKPLCSAIHRVSAPWSARQQRHLSYVAEFTSDLRYVPGDKNVVADAMSKPFPGTISLRRTLLPTSAATRLSAVELPPPLDFVEMLELQTSCPSLQDLLDNSMKFS